MITIIDYFIKWTEVVVLKEENEYGLNFYKELIARFGVPKSIILDNVLSFVGTRITDYAIKI